MAVVLLTENNRNAIPAQITTIIVLLGILGLTYVTLLFASQVHRIIGDVGANLSRRVLGMVLAALAAENVLSALETIIQTRPA